MLINALGLAGSQAQLGEEPLGIQRLWETGVRPRHHYALDVLRAGKSRHGDDPDMIQRGTRPQAAADFESIHAGHHQIQQQRMRSERLDLRARFEAIARNLDGNPRIARFDYLGKVQAQLNIVLNNQHAVGAAGAARHRWGAPAPREFLDITEKETAVTT